MMPPINNNNNNNNVSEFGFIIRKCQYQVKSSCNNSHVEFYKREVNVVAHPPFCEGNHI